MSSKPNLVVCFRQDPVDERHIARIAATWPEVNIINTGQSGIAEALFEADYFCGHAKVPVPWDAVVAAGRLRWVQSSAAGMDWLLVPSVIGSEIIVTTASGVLADQVSEHGLALTLAWHRNLRSFILDQTVETGNPDWRKFKRKPTRDLTEKTVGIVGLGGVGRRFSEVVRPFARRILAVDLYPENKPPQVDDLWSADRLDDLLSASDVVFLSLPLCEATRGIFDRARLERMKKDALLVNMARGPLVDSDALADLIASGNLAGAVMDVTSPEPLPSGHPLWSLPQVLITPHVGGQIRWRFDDVCDIFCENVRRFLAGEPLINRLSTEGKRLGFPLRNGETPLWIDLKQRYSTRC